MTPTILLLGATGRAGRVAARLLLEHTAATVVLAGRDRTRAAALADGLARDFPGGRVDIAGVDVSDESGLRAALAGRDLLFDCAPTASFTHRIPLACIAAGVDCLDIHPSRSLELLRPLAREIARAGRCVVTQAGLHPGMPATIIRHAATLVGHCDTVAAAMLFNVGDVPGPDSVVEIIEAMGDYKSLVWSGGAWRKPSWSHSRRFDFGPGLGPRPCWPMWSDELEGLPERAGLKEVGFYVAGFNAFADLVVTPLAVALGSIHRGLGARPLARALAFSVRRFTRPPFAIALVAEASGGPAGARRTARVVVRSDDDDGYRLTAAPAVACAMQLLGGGIARPGVHLMGQLVEPVRLAADLRRMGIGVEAEAGP